MPAILVLVCPNNYIVLNQIMDITSSIILEYVICACVPMRFVAIHT